MGGYLLAGVLLLMGVANLLVGFAGMITSFLIGLLLFASALLLMGRSKQSVTVLIVAVALELLFFLGTFFFSETLIPVEAWIAGGIGLLIRAFFVLKLAQYKAEGLLN